MAYFKINNIDFSHCVNKLTVDTKHKYTARENASGNLMVKYITNKKNLKVGIIPLTDSQYKSFLTEINKFQVTVTFLNPQTNSLETIDCIIPINTVEYYTIQADKKMLKAFNITCEQL